MRLLFLGEGRTDVGDEDHPANGGPYPEHWRVVGAVVPVLVRKMLEAVVRRTLPFATCSRLFAHVHRGGFRRKVRLSVVRADRERFDAVVAVMDNDREPGHQRLKLLRAGREDARLQDEAPIPCAVGVAVEAIEAWLLDPVAARDGLGLESAPTQPKSPESLAGRPGEANHPKTVFRGWLAQTPRDRFRAITEAMAAVAESTDVADLEERCPRGFKPFADDVRGQLGPLWKERTST